MCTDDFILIDYKKLAEKLADIQFKREYEEVYSWTELYEQVDESHTWYLKNDYQLIYNCIVSEWETKLVEYDITNYIDT